MDRERDALSIEDLTYDSDGLIPAVIQDRVTGEVLMVAYMNAESLRRSIETRYTWFWSRSRQEYWKKGETSGHVQVVRSIAYDCDADCLLVRVEQTGPACHTQQRSCFYRTLVDFAGSDAETAGSAGKAALTGGTEPGGAKQGSVEPAASVLGEEFALGDTLAGLWSVLEQRKRDLPEGSYTAKLLTCPRDKVLKKIAEESGEVIIAACDEDLGQLTYEIGDLFYHLLVVMLREGVTPETLAAELKRRAH